MTFNEQEKHLLLTVAKDAILHGLEQGRSIKLDLAKFPATLTQAGASFVTLEKQGSLRGCIGTLQAYQPLAQDVADHAYAAAFDDPRFHRIEATEIQEVDIHISILSTAEEIKFSSEQDLLSKIRPGVDGLILEDGVHRGTFLPSVWTSLPKPVDFLNQLKQKAGLPTDYWSDTIRVSRYTTVAIP